MSRPRLILEDPFLGWTVMMMMMIIFSVTSCCSDCSVWMDDDEDDYYRFSSSMDSVPWHPSLMRPLECEWFVVVVLV